MYYKGHRYPRSSPSRKRMYGSAYHKGITSKYQRYGRTMRLDPGYGIIPRSLPTRQSQMAQIEELRKAGLIPYPSPPGPNYSYYSDCFVSSQSDFNNKDISYVVNSYCESKGYDINNLIGVSFSGVIQQTLSVSSGYTTVMRFLEIAEDPTTNSHYMYMPLILKNTASSSINMTYNVILHHPEFVQYGEALKIRCKKIQIVFQGKQGNGQMSLLYNNTDNQFVPYDTHLSPNLGFPTLNDPNWHNTPDRSLYSIETPPTTDEIPYYYLNSTSIVYGKIDNSSGIIYAGAGNWHEANSLSLWTRLNELALTYGNCTYNNGILLEFAIPDN